MPSFTAKALKADEKPGLSRRTGRAWPGFQKTWRLQRRGGAGIPRGLPAPGYSPLRWGRGASSIWIFPRQQRKASFPLTHGPLDLFYAAASVSSVDA